MRGAWNTVREVAVIVAAGALLGLAINGLGPHGVALGHPIYAAAESGSGTCAGPGGTRIAPRSAAGLCSDCNVAFVDARVASAFAHGHIAGAIHMPPVGHRDEAGRMADLARKKTVVVYDDLSSCNFADSVAQRLRLAGVKDVRVLEGGWPAWQRGQQPAASGACDVCAAGHD